MNCQEVLQEFGLSDVEASAALHYLADHLAHTLAPPENSLELFHRAYRCGVRDACDALRHETGDEAITVPVFPDLHTTAA